MKVSFDPAFRRSFQKRIHTSEKLKKRFNELLPIFIANPFDTRLRTHKLSGRLEGLYSFRIDYDLRVVFYFVDDDRAVFVDIGTHDEVY